jgi:hypothetical protein
MVPKTITVIDTTCGESKEMLGSQNGYTMLLSRLGVAFVVNSEGVRVNDFESLVDGGKYTLGPPLQQQQVPLPYQPVIEFVKKQMEEHTETKAFSKAGYTFARLLLNDRGIQVRTAAVNLEQGQCVDPPVFDWTIETKDDQQLRPGEHFKTSNARDWFLQNFLAQDKVFGLKVVTGCSLPELTGHHKKANGKTDLVIGKKDELDISSDAYDFAFGIIELKQDIYPIKKGQNILELASLSTISRVGQNCSLLATDCNKAWELYWFEDTRTIVRGVYRSSRKCWEDFKALLEGAEQRVLGPPSKHPRPVLPNYEASIDAEDDHALEEQNLDGFDAGDSKIKSLELQAQLSALANDLGALYGNRPSIPFWARAENRCPDYYA